MASSGLAMGKINPLCGMNAEKQLNKVNLFAIFSKIQYNHFCC